MSRSLPSDRTGRTIWILLAVVACLALVAAACGDDAGTAADDTIADDTIADDDAPPDDADEPADVDMEAVTWRHQGVLAPEHFVAQEDQALAEALSQATGGQLELQIHDGAGLGIAGSEALRAVGDGLMDVARIWMAHVEGDYPQGVIMELPYLVPNQKELRMAVAEELRPYLEEGLAEQNVVLLNFFQVEARNAYTTTAVETLDDLEGLQLRAQGGMEAQFTEAIGSGAVTVEWEETFSALQQGVVDGYWVTHASTISFGLEEIATHSWETEQGGAVAALIVNRDAWEALPADVQGIVMAEAAASAERGWDRVFEIDDEASQELIDGGMVINRASEEDTARMTEIAEEVWDWWLDRTPEPAQEMFDAVGAVVEAHGG